MAANISNAVKTFLEGAGLGVACYRDAAPANEEMPYITISEGLITTTDDRADGGRSSTVSELIQIDLWEVWRDADNEVVESPTLARDVVEALHGAQLPAAPMRAYGVTVLNRRRLLEADLTGPTYRGVVHTAITATVFHAA